VSRRRTEPGIRMALGAGPRRVRLVLVGVSMRVGLGLLVGSAISIWASAFVAPLLYGLGPRDPATLIWSAIVLAAFGAIAGSVPALSRVAHRSGGGAARPLRLFSLMQPEGRMRTSLQRRRAAVGSRERLRYVRGCAAAVRM